MKKILLALAILAISAGCVKTNPHTTPAPRSEVETKAYTNADLGISFNYPVQLGDVEFNMDNGETGKKFVGVFTGNRNVQFGGLTKDYTAGRGGYFLDTTGFTEKNGNSYYKFVNGNEVKANIDQGITAKNTNGILVKGYPEDGPGSPANPGMGSYGAIFNLNNSTFPGIAFWDMEGALSKEDFLAMLSTLEVK